MNETSLNKLYTAVSKNFDIGTYDEFKTAMLDPIRRKKFYDFVTKGNQASLNKLYTTVSKKFDIGTYDEFQTAMLSYDRRVKFHSIVSKKLDIGTFDEFETKIGIKKLLNLGTFDEFETKIGVDETGAKKVPSFVNVNIKPEDITNNGKLVKRGMSGDIVKKIQELLIKHGFTNISKSGNVDGIFGSRTKQAVIDFQRKNDASDDGIVGNETWGKLIQEPKSAKIPLKLDPKTGLPDNSFGLPKFNPDLKRFEKYNVSTAQQDADLKKLGLKENMKLTDIITGMVQEQGELTPNQRLAMTKGFGPVSAEYADKLVKDGTLKNSGNGQTPGGMTMPTTTVTANKQKSTSLPKGVPSMPSLKDVLNPTKSNLGPVSNKPTAPAAKPAGKLPSGVPSMPSLKDVLNPTKATPWGASTAAAAPTATPWGASTAAAKAAGDAAAPAVKPQQPNSLTDVAKGGYLRSGMKGNVVRDMQVLINSLNNPDIKVDQSGVFNQDTLNAVIKLQKMLGVKPKNGKYGIFGPVTIAAINKSKSGANDNFKIDPKTGLPYDTVGAMRDKLPNADTTTNSSTPSPKFNTDASRFSKYGVSKAQQDADLKKLGINEDLIKKIVNKQLRSL